MREEEVRKHRQNANVDSQSVSIEQEEPYIIHSFSWSIYNNSLAVKKLDKTTYVVYILMEVGLSDWEKEIIEREKKNKATD